MSHLKERKETNCLNCNAEVNGKFCSVCGQENIEPAETALHLVSHFFNDITHFDGKFFSSLKYLVFKPGFLSTEYRLGRRASYLNPVRMYIFTSFIFFLVFFSVYHVDDFSGTTKFGNKGLNEVSQMDSAQFDHYINNLQDTGTYSKTAVKEQARKSRNNTATLTDYKSKEEYDSLLASGKLKDGWFKRKINYRQIELSKKYDNSQSKLLQALLEKFTHSFPQMFFVSLPLFAFLLKLLYIRRKQFYYVSHAIFSIHFYVFTFLLLLLVIGVGGLVKLTGWSGLSWISGLIYIWMFIYQYKAMRNFYGQGRGKTILKFLLSNIAFLFLVILIFCGFLLFSYLKV